ncbi:MAG: hypothetical protein OEZ01_04280 [Candidatus Heimdallarchaeota archaeon]|nr:hypothetical protein [Candidatus Heimdallarchaeota archaeon]MDH5645198.1 hypothetical protein [Candidatus Heimdallarchaeota archaeon]
MNILRIRLENKDINIFDDNKAELLYSITWGRYWIVRRKINLFQDQTLIALTTRKLLRKRKFSIKHQDQIYQIKLKSKKAIIQINSKKYTLDNFTFGRLQIKDEMSRIGFIIDRVSLVSGDILVEDNDELPLVLVAISSYLITKYY